MKNFKILLENSSSRFQKLHKTSYLAFNYHPESFLELLHSIKTMKSLILDESNQNSNLKNVFKNLYLQIEFILVFCNKKVEKYVNVFLEISPYYMSIDRLTLDVNVFHEWKRTLEAQVLLMKIIEKQLEIHPEIYNQEFFTKIIA